MEINETLRSRVAVCAIAMHKCLCARCTIKVRPLLIARAFSH